MKKTASFTVLLISLLAVFAFSSSAANEISYPKIDKNVYGTGVLHWTMKSLHDDYYFEIYVNDEKIKPQLKYNGTTFYCYIDDVYPEIKNKYTIEYYTKGEGRYVLMDSEYIYGTIDNAFYPYSSSKVTAESNSSTTMKLSWSYDDYDIGYIKNYENSGYFFDDDTIKYKVYCRPVDGDWEMVGETGSENYTVNNLTEGKEYQFKIEAYCKTVSDSKPKLVDISDIVDAKVAIQYFENVKVDSITETTAVVKWDFDKAALLGTGLYADEVSFDIYLEDYNYDVTKIGTTKDNEFEITGLERGEEYAVTVKANCTRTNGINELVEETETIDFETKYLYISDFKVDSTTSSTANLSWSVENGIYGDCDEVYFCVYLENPDGSATRIGKTDKCKFTVKNLESSTDYKVKIALFANEFYWEDLEKIEVTDVVSFRTRLEAPEKIIISYDPDFKTATVKWSVVDNANGYILYRYDYDLKEYERLVKQKGRTYEFSYTAGEKYKFYVKPYQTVDGKDTAGEGAGKTFLPASKITLSVSANTLKVGKKLTVKPVITPSSSTDSIKWTTSNSKIATVSSKGVVKALKNGTATITATTSSGKKASIKIIVSNAAISSTSKTVNIGQKITLKINNYSGTVKWSTSNKKIATVSSKGVVKGVSKGTVTITAKLGNGATLSCKVKVTKAFISPSKLSILIDQSSKLTLMNATSSVSWSSSNSKIAKVDKKGNVIGVAKGTATIYATCGGVRYSCVVTVKTPPVTFKKVGWYIGSAGGVYPQMVIKNNTKKDIGKVEFNVFFLQADGSYSYCDIYSDYEWILYTIGTLKAGKTMTFEWSEAVHWNVNVSALYFDKVTVYYTDGTSYTYDCDTLWYDKNYYGNK